MNTLSGMKDTETSVERNHERNSHKIFNFTRCSRSLEATGRLVTGLKLIVQDGTNVNFLRMWAISWCWKRGDFRVQSYIHLWVLIKACLWQIYPLQVIKGLRFLSSITSLKIPFHNLYNIVRSIQCINYG